MIADFESITVLCGGAPREAERKRVEPIHTRLPGRVRLTVARLRHNAGLARALSLRLPGVSGIHSALPNPLSGNLLVRFDPKLDVAAVLSAVESVLDDQDSAGVDAADPPPGQAFASAPLTGAWHAAPAASALEYFGTSASDGLSTSQAAAQRARHGANILPPAPERSVAEILREQVASLPVALLIGSAVVSVATGGLLDAGLVISVIAANAAIGYVTTRQAERLIRSLSETPLPPVAVVRDGKTGKLAAREVVPGDVLVLAPGTIVPADARLIASIELGADESALTGESMPVPKSVAAVAVTAPLAEQSSMIHRGTTIVSGRGRAVVTATGTATEIGAIQALASTARAPQTPLERQLDQLGRWLAVGSLLACAGVYVVGRLRGYSTPTMLTTSAALAVAAVPEGLPTVATVTLALGIRRMRGFGVLVRRLDAIETLGAVNVVCFDKTGTLTENSMSVRRFVADGQTFLVRGRGLVDAATGDAAPGSTGLRRLLEVAVLCNDAAPVIGDLVQNGSATERALLDAATTGGLDVMGLREACPLDGRIDRAPGRRYMTTTHRTPAGRLRAVKGSPEEVLGLCQRYLASGEERSLLPADRARIAAQNEALAREGLRVLGFAAGPADAPEGPADGLVWLGLAGLADPVRPGMRELMHELHEAGVETVMITGDQSMTAYAIARELDLADGQPIEILDGPYIDATPLETLTGLAPRTHVFARVSPAHKLSIVQALQRAGKVVAMTGDGINDSPALRAADIGLAMGRTGTDAAREMADVVLADDNLATIVVAIREGRTLHHNIRKAVRFLLSTNLSELATVAASVSLSLSQPLTAAQLLWLNLVTDVAPALALGVEAAPPEVLHERPSEARAPIFAANEAGRIMTEGALIGTSALAAHRYGVARFGAPNGGGVGFLACITAQLLHGWSSRDPYRPLLTASLPPNPSLMLALGGLGTLQALTALFPPTRAILGIGPLDAAALGVVGLAGAAPFLVNETLKGVWPAASPVTPSPGGHR